MFPVLWLTLVIIWFCEGGKRRGEKNKTKSLRLFLSMLISRAQFCSDWDLSRSKSDLNDTWHSSFWVAPHWEGKTFIIISFFFFFSFFSPHFCSSASEASAASGEERHWTWVLNYSLTEETKTNQQSDLFLITNQAEGVEKGKRGFFFFFSFFLVCFLQTERKIERRRKVILTADLKTTACVVAISCFFFLSFFTV